MPFSNYAKGQIRAQCRFAKLHVGDPGPDFTDNPAQQTLRVPITLDPAGKNVGALQWPTCPAIEVISHVSAWDAATGGNPWMSGQLADPEPVIVNQLLEIAEGKLQVNLK